MRPASSIALAALATLSIACGPDPEGLAVLAWNDSIDPANVDMEVMVTSADGLNQPMDLAFDPDEPTMLWIPNRADDSMTIVFDAGLPTQSSENRVDPYALHFMEEVSSIDFGQSGTFGPCQESRNTYNGQAAPNDFTGPTLWPSNLDVFAESNPAAVEYLTQLFGFPTDLGSHLDMQHETPLCTGIAWERDNVYWTFDGLNETIDRVDFQEDHGPGYDDHSDGITAEYGDTGIGYLEGVPNHMVFDAATSLLYVADPANSRIVALDTTTGTRGQDLPVTEPGTQHYTVEGAESFELIGADAGMDQPSGLAMVDGVLFVTDHGTGVIHAFDVVTGEEIDRLTTNRGGGTITGIVAPNMDELWLVDSGADEVLRIRPHDVE